MPVGGTVQGPSSVPGGMRAMAAICSLVSGSRRCGQARAKVVTTQCREFSTQTRFLAAISPQTQTKPTQAAPGLIPPPSGTRQASEVDRRRPEATGGDRRRPEATGAPEATGGGRRRSPRKKPAFFTQEEKITTQSAFAQQPQQQGGGGGPRGDSTRRRRYHRHCRQ